MIDRRPSPRRARHCDSLVSSRLLPLAFPLPTGDVSVLIINQGSSSKTLDLVSVEGRSHQIQDASMMTENAYEGAPETTGASRVTLAGRGGALPACGWSVLSDADRYRRPL